MFPGETSSTSPESYKSSSFCSPGSTLTISVENSSSSYTYPLFHHLCPTLQQQASHYSAPSLDMAARDTERSSNLHPSIQAAIAAGYLSIEEAQLLILQDPGHNYASHALQPLQAGLSMNSMHAQFYNEQILHSLSGSHFTGIEPAENQELLNSMQLPQQSCSSTSHAVLQNLSLDQNMNYIGRSISSVGGPAAPVRYEETCTPRPRWSPTPEQIEILEALFNAGTRTPSRDMIADIAEQLRKYGTIAEANVFYWFQNRKARAKRKQLQPPSR